MKNIVVIGAGFAGMWAALSAARLISIQQRTDIQVTVLAPVCELQVRPRLYEFDSSSFTTPLLPLLTVCGVRFRQGVVKIIDCERRQIHYQDACGVVRICNYDRLIVASGSMADRAAIPGACDFGFDIDSPDGTTDLINHFETLARGEITPPVATVVVAGGGLTGIELATELPAHLNAIFKETTPVKVIVVDSAMRPGGRFSTGMSATIAEAMTDLQIEWRAASSISQIQREGVTLADGSFIATRTTILTAGVKASPLTAQIGKRRDSRDRLLVNRFLEAEDAEAIYAAGDVAHAAVDETGRLAPMTCQHAIPMGKYAGHNAAASLLGAEKLPYSQPNYVTCVDLGAWGALYTEGWQQEVKFTRSAAKEIKTAITHRLIYPPQADRDIAFAQANPLAKFV